MDWFDGKRGKMKHGVLNRFSLDFREDKKEYCFYPFIFSCFCNIKELILETYMYLEICFVK